MKKTLTPEEKKDLKRKFRIGIMIGLVAGAISLFLVYPFWVIDI